MSDEPLNEHELTALENSSGDDCDMSAVRCVVREVRALRIRRDELLAAMVRVTRETPYPEEAGNAGVLLAEVGTLKSALTLALRERDEARALADEWKRRAVAHGCDAEKGDPDCG